MSIVSLTPQHWQSLDQVILRVLKLETLVELEHFILEELPPLIGATFSSWNEHNSQLYLEKVVNSSSHESQVAKLLPELNASLSSHPSFVHFYDFEKNQVRLIDTVERTRELDVQNRYHQTNFYKKVASKMAIEDQLLMHLYVKDGRGILLTFHGEREFTPLEHLVASILRGHLLAKLYVLSQSLPMKNGKSKEVQERLQTILTAREYEVFRWLCAGFSNGEIADKTKISPRTVDRHVAQILNKLQEASRNRVIAKYAIWMNS